jgi:hypothetical protein
MTEVFTDFDGDKFIIGECDTCSYIGKIYLSKTDTSGFVICTSCKDRIDAQHPQVVERKQ